MSERSSLELRTQAVRLWGSSTATLAQSAQDCVESIQGNLSAYTDLPSVSADVRYASERMEAALIALYDVEAAAQRITEARLAEEQER
jgi:hypothetical protein